ncbi:MAG: hypothetical protein R8K46_03040 [Mariprofundaceae bacterium]
MKRSGLMLAGVYALAVPVFMWMQWSPATFVREKLETVGLGQILHFDHIETTWRPGLHAQGARFMLASGQNILVEHVWLSPAWLQIFQARPAVHICGEWKQQGFSLTLMPSDGDMQLRDMEIVIDASQLKDHLKGMTMGMDVLPQGALHLYGDVDVTSTGVPMWADVGLSWEHARITMGDQQGYELGDYVFTMVSKDRRWPWLLKGGEQLAVSGSGTLQPSGISLKQWGVQGSLEVEAEGVIGGVLAMLSGGAKHATALLSGSLGRPRVQWRQ